MTDSFLGKALRGPRALARRTLDSAAEWEVLHDLRLRLRSRQDRYTDVYDSQAWESAESGSGTGSELRATDNVRERLPGLLRRLGARSLLDAPCGDWNWMRHVDLPVEEYFGVDIVPSVIEENRRRFGGAGRAFSVADLSRDPLPAADVVLCRDCLVHVSYQDAAAILENFRATGAEWLLLNTYPEIRRNRNQFTGARWRRLNFSLPPFGFPEPLETISDGGDVDPSQLGVWKLQQLPRIGAF
ncbi:class I SAM-dependent methyltransferase [Amycolatopsis acidicola]|uniref:Class I SAM-dependent methyltransferase n=1 Tax=Amycolatopsis acidicola TaxID=2596893 RepID=A0A5N0VFM5_9PSEU|nr:class I SAM-dependent methyltransferase [Amycolatopsis acidicola]KAA9163611.1 class I SAM-dependent methyltransferase [Amycolatopsis acidicola]